VSTRPSTPTIPRHADFCGPAAGEVAPRIEAFRAAKYGPDGIAPAGFVQVVRCVECAFATYDGVLRES